MYHLRAKVLQGVAWGADHCKTLLYYIPVLFQKHMYNTAS